MAHGVEMFRYTNSRQNMTKYHITTVHIFFIINLIWITLNQAFKVRKNLIYTNFCLVSSFINTYKY